MTTADQMFDALNLDELTIVAGLARARLDAYEHGPNALAVYVDRVGEQAARWALGWSIAWSRKRDAERAGAVSIDPIALVEALPPSMRAWSAKRLASPVCADAEEAREMFEMNAELLAQLGGAL